jgi:hypothetical protein
LSEINNNDLSLARSMPPGAVHTNNSRVTSRQIGQLIGSRASMSSSKRP